LQFVLHFLFWLVITAGAIHFIAREPGLVGARQVWQNCAYAGSLCFSWTQHSLFSTTTVY